MREHTVIYETAGCLSVMDRRGNIEAQEEDASFTVFFTRQGKRRGTITIVNDDTQVAFSVPADDIIQALQEGAEHGNHFDLFGPFRRLVV